MTNQAGELLQDQIQCKWITAPDQHADQPGQTLLTRDRAVIRGWANARGAEPATGVGTVQINDGGAAIRFAFPGVGRLTPISWDEWFENFDEYDLVFAFEEQTVERLQSHKYRLIRKENLRQYGADAAPLAGEFRTTDESRPTERESPAPASDSGQHARARRRRGWRRLLNLFRPARAHRSSSGR